MDIREKINVVLEQEVGAIVADAELAKAVSYAVLGGGKRVRPALSTAVVEDFGGDAEAAIRAACGIELFHAASLVHDDLPALDDDLMRRGRPTTHRRFGEGLALLTGDLLSIRAIEVMNRQLGALERERAQLVLTSVIRSFSSVVIGQALDISPTRTDADYERLIRLKTGELFGAAVLVGAAFSPLPTSALSQFDELGIRIGVVFQLIDDCIDRFGSESDCGRAPMSDARNQRDTPFSRGEGLEGMEFLEDAADELSRALHALETVHKSNLSATRRLVASLFERVNGVGDLPTRIREAMQRAASVFGARLNLTGETSSAQG